VSKFQQFQDEDTILDGAEFVPVTPEDGAPVSTIPINPPPVVPEEGLSAKLRRSERTVARNLTAAQRHTKPPCLSVHLIKLGSSGHTTVQRCRCL